MGFLRGSTDSFRFEWCENFAERCRKGIYGLADFVEVAIQYVSSARWMCGLLNP